MNTYFISGLGADKRAFQRLALPASIRRIHLDWFPIEDGDTLGSYIERFSKQIDAEQPFDLVGMSFGGMVAVELSKFLRPRKTVLISSISCYGELPLHFQCIGKIGLHKLIPRKLLNKTYFFTDWFFGAQTKVEKQLLKNIVHETSDHFLKWAIHEILRWKNKTRPDNIYHIHGSKDRIFPCSRVRYDRLVVGGGHFMVYRNAKEISKILTEYLMEKP